MTVNGQDETVAARPAPTCATVQCAAGMTCVNGTCVTDKCAIVKCPAGYICKDGKCVPELTCATINCENGHTCVNNTCVPIANPCDSVRCASPTTCVDGGCVDECATVDCPYGPCKVFDGVATCASRTCSCDSECPNTEKCIDNKGCYKACVDVKPKCVQGYWPQGVNHECSCQPTKSPPVESATDA